MFNKFNLYFILFILSAMLNISVYADPDTNNPAKNSPEINNIVIIGGGPCGLSAAVYASRAELNPLVIEGEPGQLTKASLIENMPGIPPILGIDLVENMHQQAEELGARFMKGNVVDVDFSSRPFKLWTKEDNLILANSVIIATGTKKSKLNCPGEDKYQNKGVALCATCDGPFYKDRNIVLIGGDYSALREAIILSKFTDKLKIINKRPALKGPNSLLKPVIKNPNITILNNSKAIEIMGDEQQATGVKIVNTQSKKEETIPSDVIFIATNWLPQTEIFKDKLDLDDKNRIKVHNNTLTSVPGVLAAGDVTDNSYHQVPTASADGYKAGMDAEKYLIKNNLLEATAFKE